MKKLEHIRSLVALRQACIVVPSADDTPGKNGVFVESEQHSAASSEGNLMPCLGWPAHARKSSTANDSQMRLNTRVWISATRVGKAAENGTCVLAATRRQIKARGRRM